MANQLDFTTVVAVDDGHLRQLKLVWPTWRKHRPQIMEHPLLLICDAAVARRIWRDRLAFLDHPDLQIETCDMPDAERNDDVTQREKMLSGLVFGAAQHVKTPWYLKLDTDTVALKPGDWLQDSWFGTNDAGQLPVFVSNPWGYTKLPTSSIALTPGPSPCRNWPATPTCRFTRFPAGVLYATAELSHGAFLGAPIGRAKLPRIATIAYRFLHKIRFCGTAPPAAETSIAA